MFDRNEEKKQRERKKGSSQRTKIKNEKKEVEKKTRKKRAAPGSLLARCRPLDRERAGTRLDLSLHRLALLCAARFRSSFIFESSLHFLVHSHHRRELGRGSTQMKASETIDLSRKKKQSTMIGAFFFCFSSSASAISFSFALVSTALLSSSRRSARK